MLASFWDDSPDIEPLPNPFTLLSKKQQRIYDGSPRNVGLDGFSELKDGLARLCSIYRPAVNFSGTKWEATPEGLAGFQDPDVHIILAGLVARLGDRAGFINAFRAIGTAEEIWQTPAKFGRLLDVLYKSAINYHKQALDRDEAKTFSREVENTNNWQRYVNDLRSRNKRVELPDEYKLKEEIAEKPPEPEPEREPMTPEELEEVLYSRETTDYGNWA